MKMSSCLDAGPPLSMPQLGQWLRHFETLRLGALLLDSNGRVAAFNNVAAELNGRFFHLRHGCLHLNIYCLHSNAVQKHRRFLGQNIVAMPRTHLRLVAEDGTQCVASIRHQQSSEPGSQYVLMIFREANGSTKSLAHMLIEDLGLSFAEARMVVELHKTCDLSETAQSLGLSKETVRTQLKAVFTKMDVCKQSEVILRVEQLLSLQL